MNRITFSIAAACIGLAIGGCDHRQTPPSDNTPANPSTAPMPGANPLPVPAHTAPMPASSSSTAG